MTSSAHLRTIARRALRSLPAAAPLALIAACADRGPLAPAEPPDTFAPQAAALPSTAKGGRPGGPGGLIQDIGRIVYITGVGSVFEVHSMNPDGSGDKQLTSSASPQDPKWSPDYKRIAFTSSKGAGGGGIYVMNADGSGLQQITTTGSYTRTVSWSPDGKKLVFSATVGNSSIGEVFVVNANGTGLTRLTFSTAEDLHPTFSKDGTRIVFVSSRQNPSYNRDLWSMAADGSGPTRLTQTPENESSPAFSPDGMQLAWVADGKLMVGGAFAGRPQVIPTPSSVQSPTWSRDGKALAYETAQGWTGAFIERLDLATGKAVRVWQGPGSAGSPHWAY